MTRAEWIQQYVLDACATGKWDEAETVADAKYAADALEKSGAAPWSDSEPELDALGDTREESSRTRRFVEAEREACAQIAEEETMGCEDIANAIRARTPGVEVKPQRKINPLPPLAPSVLTQADIEVAVDREREACADIADARCRVGGDACGVAREIRARSHR
jgi:hypothetical protein